MLSSSDSNQNPITAESIAFETILAQVIEDREAGNVVAPEIWYERFPEHRESLQQFFENERILDPLGQSTDLLSPLRATVSSASSQAGNASLANGTIVDDFELVDELARGGMGVVYQARQISLRRSVALKFLSDGVFANAEQRTRFRLEAEAAAALSHPHILPIFGWGQWQGHDYFVMPLVTGATLQTYVTKRHEQLTASVSREKAQVNRRRLSNEERSHLNLALKFVRDIARAVAFAHRRGIIHRDLKPENVLVEDGRAKIVDFGLAKWQRDDSNDLNESPALTREGQILGTPHYMSPEQAGGSSIESTASNGDVTAASDIYALGGILMALLTGQPPHSGATTAEVLSRIVHDEPPCLKERWLGGMPKDPALNDLERVLARAMASDPARRYRSADDLADDLDRVLRGDTPQAVSDGLFDRVSRELVRDPHQTTFVAWGNALRRIGVVVGVAHLIMWSASQSGIHPVLAYLIPRLIMLLGIGWIIHRARDGLWFPRVSAERPVWSIWLGYLMTLAVVNVMWLAGQFSQTDVIVIACLMSGFAFIAMAGHLWGGTSFLGGLFFVATALSVVMPDSGPLFLGSGWVIAMWVLGRRYDQPSTSSSPSRTAT